VAAVVALRLGAKRSQRTRYRPASITARDLAVAAAGLAAPAALVAAGFLGVPELTPSIAPLTAPTLPLLPALGILVALAPAWLHPRIAPWGREERSYMDASRSANAPASRPPTAHDMLLTPESQLRA
jgi:energy-coupling factor transport system permease protein